jgi:hypothetical protein
MPRELTLIAAFGPGENKAHGHVDPASKRAIEQAGDSPVRLTGPETHRKYVLVGADVYDRLLEQEERREEGAVLRLARKNAKARLMEGE